MGSRSTNIKCGLGGFKGRRLLDGDYISFRAKRRYLPYFLSRSLDLNEFDQDNITLRVIMGPQDDAFTAAGKETFLSSEYVVTSEFDGMGAVWKDHLLHQSQQQTLSLMESHSVLFRYLAMENQSFCWRTDRLPADMRRLLQSSL